MPVQAVDGNDAGKCYKGVRTLVMLPCHDLGVAVLKELCMYAGTPVLQKSVLEVGRWKG